MTHTQERRQVTETAYERAQILVLTGKDFTITIINILKGLKETMLKEVNENMTILQQIDNSMKREK